MGAYPAALWLEKTWRPLADDNFHLGLGYTLGVTARDNWKLHPDSGRAALASIGYGPATFQMTYIPGTYNNGNVYFCLGAHSVLMRFFIAI